MERINESYETKSIYEGLDSYHSHSYSILNRPIDENGYVEQHDYLVGVEMEVEFDYENDRDDFVYDGSNYHYCECDGSLDDYGCEIITVPLRPSDAKSEDFWEPLYESLCDVANADDHGTCGLHVHFSKTILGYNEVYTENLGKLLYLYHHILKDKRLNTGVYGRTRCYHEHDGKTPEGKAIEVLGTDLLKNKAVREQVAESMRDKSRSTRYFDINITNAHTIEFRKGQGTIQPKRITQIVEYSELMCKYVCATDWAELCYDGFVEYILAESDNVWLKNTIQSYA